MRRLDKNRQTGIVLFMSMIMLLMLTVLGVSSIQTTSLQQRMAVNATDSNLAFQAAESALRDGEDFLESLNSMVDWDGGSAQNNGFYFEANTGVTPHWKALDWSAGTGSRQGESTISGVNSQPRYILEHVKTVISDADALNLDNIGQDTGSGRTQMFRVTARGTGGTDQAVVVLQGTYGKRI